MLGPRHPPRLTAVWSAFILAAAGIIAIVSVAAPARASYGISTQLGIDSCAIQSVQDAQNLWTNTPYYNLHFYLGGGDARCPQNDPSFISGVLLMGWKLDPIWVGPQSTCADKPQKVYFSNDTSTAYSQGQTEAFNAYEEIRALGLDVADTPITYDLEAFNTGNSTCLAAARSFIQGWVVQMHVPTAQKAGLYGSTCGTGLEAFADLNPAPDYITGAQWDNNPNTNVMGCGVIGWVDQQRHKQFDAEVSRFGYNVDEDCSNGPVYPYGDTVGGQGCV
jgi:hypothetical protein